MQEWDEKNSATDRLWKKTKNTDSQVNQDFLTGMNLSKDLHQLSCPLSTLSLYSLQSVGMIHRLTLMHYIILRPAVHVFRHLQIVFKQNLYWEVHAQIDH